MARRDLRDIKEEVRARIDIVDIISGYTRLKPAGKSFKGLCPFHADKTPSFSVNPTFQSYRCWSCGESGDVFTFIEKKENLTFIEALESLAQRAGIPFERTGMSREKMSEREEMFELNSAALGFYRDGLARTESARDYLAGRALLKETQDRFDIGFAGEMWDGLAAFLQRRKANIALAVKAGLLRERKDGPGYTDYYRNRVMFPIHDRTGNVAGFGGRAMGDEQPKYLNSPQSEVFNKSALLYGLYFARQKLGANVPPVFVEGYTDVITAHQAGFTECVATLGTAMTETHARMLVNYNRKVILCYDADSAGINATLKGAGIWEDLGVEGAQLLIARLPAGEDPDSLLKHGDTSAFQDALDNAIPRVDFEIELALRKHDTASIDGRKRALIEIVPILATVHGATELDGYVEKMSRLHPMYNLNPVRAMESVRADVLSNRARIKAKRPARTPNYQTVEEQNRGPLQEPQSGSVQEGFQPNTTNWVQARPKQDSGKRFIRREPEKPASDRTPPNLAPPVLSAAEKAEYTLLRALFRHESRTVLLQNLTIEELITQRAVELARTIISVTPDEEGCIDPMAVLRALDVDDEASYLPEEDPFAEDNPHRNEQIQSTNGNHSTSMQDYLRDVVEDSATVLSNEPLSEATILGCVKRLQEYRKAEQIREIKRELERTDLSAEQQNECMRSLTELMRAHRGSIPGS